MAKENKSVLQSWNEWEEVRKDYYEVKKSDGSILQIPLKSISQEDLDEVNKKFTAPPVPKKPEKDKRTGKVQYIEVPDDPTYLEKVAEVEKLRQGAMVVLMIDFDIPGDTLEDKIKAVRKKITGDIVGVLRAGMALSNLNIDEEIEEAKND